MTHTVHETPVPAELADLDLLAAARRGVKQLVGLLETLPFTEYTARVAREYLDEAVLVREVFERWAQLDQAEQQRRLRLWRQAAS
ncbi:hypothetical protein [Streptomyces sp. ADI95-17]|uniref:hypothetical protein n=1 Tax=Streptomyces sp. ADI95-17 TaxID=1522759 RepID=UPI000FAF6C8A|nr:hypothetical protein [Streptomyces sp. ADI95-17]RPK55659.1 hypothetical protein EES42_41875 [Streptomyces sp. ADI95-17]